MIRVTIDVIPHGNEDDRRTVAVYEIGNVTKPEGLGDAVHGYEVRCYEVHGDDWDEPSAASFTHAPADGIGACVEAALRALREKR